MTRVALALSALMKPISIAALTLTLATPVVAQPSFRMLVEEGVWHAYAVKRDDGARHRTAGS
jgi:hypothetical protein